MKNLTWLQLEYPERVTLTIRAVIMILNFSMLNFCQFFSFLSSTFPSVEHWSLSGMWPVFIHPYVDMVVFSQQPVPLCVWLSASFPSSFLLFSPSLHAFPFVSSSPLLPPSPPRPLRPDPACPWPGPKLCPLSLLSHHSSLLPWCRLRPFAAHRKSRHRDRKLQPRRDQQLCYSGTRLHLKRRWWRLVWLRPLCCRPLPHPAVLPLGGRIALQQVWTSLATWRHLAAFTLYRLNSERPKVREEGLCLCMSTSVYSVCVLWR